MNEGGRPKKTGFAENPVFKPTLAEAGIDKSLANRARKLAAVPGKQFETIVIDARTQITNFSANISAKMLRDKDKAARRASHRARTLADGCTVEDLESLAASGYRAGVIYGDPPWRFETWTAAGKDRSADQHYNTESLSEICRLPVAALAADDCALFLWALKSNLPDAFAVMEAWGFGYMTIAFTWVKQNPSALGYFMGLGLWTRSNPEVCLLGTKGRPQRLNEDVQELVVAPVGRHSEKPEEVRQRIERLVAGPYFELYGRKPAPGWHVWGNEIPARDPST